MSTWAKILVAALFLPSLVFAQELPSPQVVTYPPGDDKIVVVHKGDPAPFTGQLYDDSTAVRWAVWLQQYKGRYAIDMKAAEEVCSVKLSTAERLAAIAAERDATVHADAVKRLNSLEEARLKAEEELRHPAFFSRPAVWFAVGVISTVAVTVSTAYLVNAASK